jgi:hypothetical protein
MTDLGIGSRIKHSVYGEGVICAVRFKTYKISFIGKGIVEIDKSFQGMEVIEEVNESDSVTVKDVERMMVNILEKYSDITQIVQLGDRWYKGSMVLKPYDSSLAPKEIPIETFFHKITMLRDRLRVLEQKINAHKNLSEDEKIEMQQYITRVYGSLTTFNVLFKYKEDQFVGQKGE